MKIGDFIRKMTDEELAQFLLDIAYENRPIHSNELLKITSPFGGYLADGVLDLHDTDIVVDALQENLPGITAFMGEDGAFRKYNDEFDVTIHCESEEEAEKIPKTLNKGLAFDKIREHIKDRQFGVEIAIGACKEKTELMKAKLEGAKSTLEDILEEFNQYEKAENGDDQC